MLRPAPGLSLLLLLGASLSAPLFADVVASAPADLNNAAEGLPAVFQKLAAQAATLANQSPPVTLPKWVEGDTVPVQAVQPSDIESLRLLGHWNIPLKLLMVASKETTDEVQAVLDVVRKIRQDPRQPGADRLKLHIIAESPDLLSRLDLTQDELGEAVEVNRHFATNDIWLQDWGEVAAARIAGETEDRLVILDTNRGRELAELPEKLARLWNGRFLKLDVESDAGNYGGNIEVLPEGTLVVGDSSSEELRQALAGFGYQDRMITLESDWLTVGHVDEYLSFLPEPESPLGFSIAKADPLAALALLRGLSHDELVAQMSEAAIAITRYGRANTNLISDDEQSITEQMEKVSWIHKAVRHPEGEVPEDLVGWLTPNQEVAKIIDRNVERLVEFVAARHGGIRPEVVSVPVLFDTASGKSIAILPDSVNMVVLGRHLVVPDPGLPVFRKAVAGVLNARGHTTHLVPNWSYHGMDGQLHCGTSVFRHPNRLLFRPKSPDPSAPSAPRSARQLQRQANFRQLGLAPER